jgi:hypothetical protein
MLIVGPNPTQGLDVCMRLFCVCLVLCAGSGLRRADPPSNDSYRLCIGLKTKNAAKVQRKDCTAIDI